MKGGERRSSRSWRGGWWSFHRLDKQMLAALLFFATLPFRPAAAWPTLPIYWHSGTSDAPLDAELATMLCSKPSLLAVTVAKFQYGEDEYTEEKIEAALATIAAACAGTDAAERPMRLAYLNSCMIFHDRYRLGGLDEVPTLSGASIGDGRAMWDVFDWTETATLTAFAKTLRNFKSSGVVDGVFLDRGDCARALDIRSNEKRWDSSVWAARRGAWIAGQASAVALAVDLFGEGNVTTNNAWFPGAARGFERWPALQPIRFQELQTVSQSVRELARWSASGRVAKATAKDCPNTLPVALAAFLVAAGEESAFACQGCAQHDGVGYGNPQRDDKECSSGFILPQGNARAWLPEYEYPLGEPISLAAEHISDQGNEVWCRGYVHDDGSGGLAYTRVLLEIWGDNDALGCIDWGAVGVVMGRRYRGAKMVASLDGGPCMAKLHALCPDLPASTNEGDQHPETPWPSVAPTSFPTPLPTNGPTELDCGSYRSRRACRATHVRRAGCIWKRKRCSLRTASPTRAPAPPSSAPTSAPTTQGHAICSRLRTGGRCKKNRGCAWTKHRRRRICTVATARPTSSPTTTEFARSSAVAACARFSRRTSCRGRKARRLGCSWNGNEKVCTYYD